MARTQADRDDDLAIGRELERKDAEIDRLRELVFLARTDMSALVTYVEHHEGQPALGLRQTLAKLDTELRGHPYEQDAGGGQKP